MAGPIQSEINSAIQLAATGVGVYQHFVNQNVQMEEENTRQQLAAGSSHSDWMRKQERKIRNEFTSDKRTLDLISPTYYNDYLKERLDSLYRSNPSRLAERDYAIGAIDRKEFVKRYNAGIQTELRTKSYPKRASQYAPGTNQLREEDE